MQVSSKWFRKLREIWDTLMGGYRRLQPGPATGFRPAPHVLRCPDGRPAPRVLRCPGGSGAADPVVNPIEIQGVRGRIAHSSFRE